MIRLLSVGESNSDLIHSSESSNIKCYQFLQLIWLRKSFRSIRVLRQERKLKLLSDSA
jgi:hypothetical protein